MGIIVSGVAADKQALIDLMPVDDRLCGFRRRIPQAIGEAAALALRAPHDVELVWELQEVSSECDLPDHDLPTKNMKCYVTNGKGHKELVEIRVSKDGTKLGLYDTDGKALKQTGRE